MRLLDSSVSYSALNSDGYPEQKQLSHTVQIQASMVRFNVRVHYMSDVYTIWAVDPQRYNHYPLIQDVCASALARLDSRMNMVIDLATTVKGGMEILQICNDEDVDKMFRLNEGESDIHVYVRATGIDEAGQSSQRPENGDHCEGEASLGGNGNVKAGLGDQGNGGIGLGEHDDGMGQVGLDDGLGEASLGEARLGDDLGFDDEVFAFSDEDEEWRPNADETDSTSDQGDVDSDVDSNHSNDDLSDYHSNSNDSGGALDSDNDGVVYPDRNLRGTIPEVSDGGKITLKPGNIFGNAIEFREKLRDFVIQEGFNIRRVKNESKRVRCVCAADGCEWFIHASRTASGQSFMIKTMNPDHSCMRSIKNPNANSAWIAKIFVDRLRANPEMTLNGMGTELLEKHGVEVSKMQLYRARKRAREDIEGNYGESYSKLAMYAEEVRRTNPGSLIKIQCDRLSPERSPTFKRFFLCLEAMKTGFFNGCRPFLGLDGCHLKGLFGGVLLAAVGLDANNGLYPLAIAIVETENKDSWAFFFRYLHTILDTNTQPWTFMSDGQKGIRDAIAEIFPESSHRRCCRHLYNNFRAKYPGIILRGHFWAAASAYSQVGFKKAMEDMKKVNSDAHDWLVKIPLSQWSRFAFDERVKNDNLTNNMAESFNGWLGDLRGRPVLTMLESIRSKLMGRICRRYEKGCSWNTLITPNICKKLNALVHEAGRMALTYAGQDEYEVAEQTTRYFVNLQLRTCNCGAWEISGLPCKHAIKCISHKRGKFEEYCHEYFSKAAYLRAHDVIIHPITDESTWHDTSTHDTLLPPPLCRLPGRPRKNRRRDPQEDAPSNFRRKSSTGRCTNCKEFGHNKTTCQRAPVRARGKGSSQTPLEGRGHGRGTSRARGRGSSQPLPQGRRLTRGSGSSSQPQPQGLVMHSLGRSQRATVINGIPHGSGIGFGTVQWMPQGPGLGSGTTRWAVEYHTTVGEDSVQFDGCHRVLAQEVEIQG
ncbi:hypothetical protein L1049_024715 [Liquidambar formosana]|uniref:SWIM-type domain-containing protein n=1 Tax=Liquidambar formosana TaxID=63359 RepID=A0AAP0X1H0_LIQFO